MILVQVSLSGEEHLGYIHIHNDGTGDKEHANYVVRYFDEASKFGKPTKKVMIKNHRRGDGWKVLLRHALQALEEE